MGRFIVLRDQTPLPKQRTRGELRTVVDVDAVEAHAEQHSAAADDLERDDSVVAYAPAMPVALVQPRAAASASEIQKEDVAWGVRAVRADVSQWDGGGVSVAVLDTGIDADHPAFAQFKQRKLEQKDFTGEGNGDRNGHGTHCAGTIFGQTVDGTRIGIAPGIRAAFIGKVLDGKGQGNTDQLVEAMLWAAKNRAQVITMSLGIDYPGYVKQLSETEDLPLEFAAWKALEAFRATVLLFEEVAKLVRRQMKNGVLIAAAGNESERDRREDYKMGVSVPAVTQEVVSVGALGRSAPGLSVAGFSNVNPIVSAPGVDILSAWPGGTLRCLSGTSMAAPHVAGVAALWAQKLRQSSNQTAIELRSRLVTSTTEQGLSPGFEGSDVGAGLVVAP